MMETSHGLGLTCKPQVHMYSTYSICDPPIRSPAILMGK